MSFAKFMATAPGRALRIVLGLALIYWGWLFGATLLAVAGLVPIAAGAFNCCLIAPLIGAPFRGADALKA